MNKLLTIPIMILTNYVMLLYMGYDKSFYIVILLLTIGTITSLLTQTNQCNIMEEEVN